MEANPLTIAAWGIGFALLAYGGYAYWQSSNVPATIDIGSPANFQSVPATQCQLSNDENSIVGTLYVFHDAARFIIKSGPGLYTVTNIIVTREGDTFAWEDGKTVGAKYDYGALYQKIHLNVLTHVTCTPWWLPAGGLFVVPDGVTIPK